MSRQNGEYKLRGEALEDYEVEIWLAMLGVTKQERVAALKDMLKHAKGDEMSPEDLVVCRMALVKLTS